MHPVLKNIFISFVAADHPATDTAAAPVQHHPAGAAARPFVLDERAFMDEIEEPPLFLQRAAE